jgi:outer membrane lipoprotein-sorting protein
VNRSLFAPVWIATAGFVLAPPARTAAQEARAVTLMEGAAARYGAASGLCADFVQHLTVPLLGDEKHGRGRLCQARPDRFAMRFTEPAGDEVVVDGSWVWLYYPSLDAKQVLRFPMARAPGGFDFHRELLDRPAEKYRLEYEASEPVGRRDTHRIRLVPREAQAFEAAVVWIDASDRLLRKVRIEEENGTVRTITLEGVQLDPIIPDDWFTFTVPPGAEVISR